MRPVLASKEAARAGPKRAKRVVVLDELDEQVGGEFCEVVHSYVSPSETHELADGYLNFMLLCRRDSKCGEFGMSSNSGRPFRLLYRVVKMRLQPMSISSQKPR